MANVLWLRAELALAPRQLIVVRELVVKARLAVRKVELVHAQEGGGVAELEHRLLHLQMIGQHLKIFSMTSVGDPQEELVIEEMI